MTKSLMPNHRKKENQHKSSSINHPTSMFQLFGPTVKHQLSYLEEVRFDDEVRKGEGSAERL